MTEEECREMARSNYAAQMEMLGYQMDGNPKDMVEVIRCKDCTYRGEINCPQYYRRTELSDDYFCADGEKGEVE